MDWVVFANRKVKFSGLKIKILNLKMVKFETFYQIAPSIFEMTKTQMNKINSNTPSRKQLKKREN